MLSCFSNQDQKTEHQVQQAAHLRAFFNHILDRYQLKFPNPCNSSVIKRVFRPPRMGIRTVIGRESVDEVIYTTLQIRDRLILKLQARGGMRIGEVLKLTPNDIDDVRVIIRNPKIGRLRSDKNLRPPGEVDLRTNLPEAWWF